MLGLQHESRNSIAWPKRMVKLYTVVVVHNCNHFYAVYQSPDSANPQAFCDYETSLHFFL